MGKYQPFFDLPAAQFQGLVDDVAKRGVLLPILVDEDGHVIDGHQRRRAAAEAGVECPQVVVAGLSEEEKQTLSLTLNLFRRHLSGTERSRALQQLANLGLSTRRMADILGISKSQVHRDLAEVERPETITDSLGREQPTTKTRDVSHMGHVDPPAGIDPETGEIVGGGDGRNDSTPPGQDESPKNADPAHTSSEGESQVPPVDAPSDSPSVPPVDPTLGYRATASRFRSQVRQSLLTLDPVRVIDTSDEPDHWAEFSQDMHDWLRRLDEAIRAGRHLRAVK